MMLSYEMSKIWDWVAWELGNEDLEGGYVYVIAWFRVKFGINRTSNVPRMGLNYTRRSRVQFTILGTLRV